MEPIVSYKGVDILRRERVVLKNVDLTVNEGEMVYMMGRVGSGKSTLLKTMYAEVPVSGSGQAKVFDFDLSNLRARQIPQLRRSMGIVFQDFQLLADRNVMQNLLFVLRATGWKDKRAMQTRIDEVLTEAGMLKKSYKMPHELSGGEQQLIVIARAMLNRPRLILADEPTGNLDPENGEIIVSRLREISRAGTAVIMATHNSSLVEKYPARVVTCESKRLVG